MGYSLFIESGGFGQAIFHVTQTSMEIARLAGLTVGVRRVGSDGIPNGHYPFAYIRGPWGYPQSNGIPPILANWPSLSATLRQGASYLPRLPSTAGNASGRRVLESWLDSAAVNAWIK
jgi:hypothetical protein